MKVKRLEDFKKVVGTCLQGYINADYKDLVNLFGGPGVGDEYKIDAEWDLEFSDGTVATIYNYKDGINYNGPDGTPVDEITEWHVGGFNSTAVNHVENYIKNNQ